MVFRRFRTFLRSNRSGSKKRVVLFVLLTCLLVYSLTRTNKRKRNYRKGLFVDTLKNGSFGMDKDTKKLASPNTKNLPHECDGWFADSFEENLAVISNYPKVKHAIIKPKTDGTDVDVVRMREKVKIMSFPVIATASDSYYYMGSQGLLQPIHEILLPKYKNLKIIFYDLGLHSMDYRELVKYCKCEVRKFPYSRFPPHVQRLATYAFKPLIVKMLLQEFGWVWWMDSSVRFISSDLDLALQYSRENSFLFFTYHVSLSVARQTDQRTLHYLNEDVCKFRYFGEVEATFMLFHLDNVTDIVVNQWASCALDQACIAPTEANVKCNADDPSDGRCHRFDQSVISILLRRLFHEQNDYPLVETPFRIHNVCRMETVQYFRTLKSKEKNDGSSVFN